MKIIVSILLFLTILSCKESRDFKSDFEKHRFDSTVINNLSQYDTLRQLILNSYDSFHLSDTNNDFTYGYNFDSSVHISGQSNLDIPKSIYPQTVQLFKKIGKSNISGFTISKDSTVEIFIRTTHLTQYYLDVRERLYWYPRTKKLNNLEFPIKDTLLRDKWQYIIWYDKRAEF